MTSSETQGTTTTTSAFTQPGASLRPLRLPPYSFSPQARSLASVADTTFAGCAYSLAATSGQADRAGLDDQQEEPDDGLTAEERARRRALEYDEEEITGDMEHERVQMEEQELVTAELPLANLPVPAGGKVWHARMPNFLEIRPKPFDDQTWDPKEEDLENAAEADQGDGVGSQEVKQRMVPDENVIRWRWTKDQLGQVVRLRSSCHSINLLAARPQTLTSAGECPGRQQVKQSNARIVRWSDGSLSLQLGAELFDMTLTLDHSAVLTSSNASGLPVPPPVNSVTAGLTASSFDTSRGHGLTYLTARHAYTGSVIEAHASVHGSIAFRPATIASQTHKRLAGMVAQRQAAAKGRSTMTAAMPEIDPELHRQQLEKKKNEAAKKAKREAAKAAGKSGRAGGRRGGAKKATRLEGLSDDDEEEDDDDAEDAEDGYSERRSQPRRGKGGPLAARDYSDDDDDEGFVAKSDECVVGLRYCAVLAIPPLTGHTWLERGVTGRWRSPTARKTRSRLQMRPRSERSSGGRSARGSTARAMSTGTEVPSATRTRVTRLRRDDGWSSNRMRNSLTVTAGRRRLHDTLACSEVFADPVLRPHYSIAWDMHRDKLGL